MSTLANTIGRVAFGVLVVAMAANGAVAADLTVTDSSGDCDSTLSGSLTYETVTIASGATLCVTAGSALSITADSITVEGTIDASGKGYAASAGPAPGADVSSLGAAGGGAYGGDGASGTKDLTCNSAGEGGARYGAEDDYASIEMGSGGGSGSKAVGGAGGGAVHLRAETIRIPAGGAILVDGDASVDQTGQTNGGGGGAGGGILIEAVDLECSGRLRARGGAGSYPGGDRGGGGGGGRIKVFYDDVLSTVAGCESRALASGGSTGDYPSLGYTCADGSDGTIWFEDDYDFDHDGVLSATADCDRADPDIYSGAPDGIVGGAPTCDGIDNDCDGNVDDLTGTVDNDCDTEDDDCDGTVDEDGTRDWYFDGDGDGYGDITTVESQCGSPGADYVAARPDGEVDCDDTFASVNPGEVEACDGVDTDCDGATDYTGELDGDMDGYILCYDGRVDWLGDTLPAGEDCDDDDAAVHEGAIEECDSIDNDCDGLVDGNDTTGSLDLQTLYRDNDGDLFGDIGTSITGCDDDFDSYSLLSTDCDDTNASVFPGATEVCDGVRNTCAGTGVPADEVDNDGDGYVECDDDPDGDGVGLDWSGTASIEGYNDCDDGDSYTHTDVARHEPGLCVRDFDGDGYGDASVPVTTSGPVAGQDCDDERANVFPKTFDACDGIDTNCKVDSGGGPDGLHPDESDEDGDGYVECAYVASTWEGDASVVAGDDCDDTEPYANPGSLEYCDGFDNDCDGEPDEDDAVDAGRWYLDSDDDGYGDPRVSALGCDLSGEGYEADNGDCNDDDPTVYPTAFEECDGQLNDCDTLGGIPDDEIDADSDEYVECGWDGTVAWAGPTDAQVGVDCDPADPQTFPYAGEICDGVFNDCNFRDLGADAPDDETDDDGDGYTECYDGGEIWVGDAPRPSVGLDCDDVDANVYPGATELCDGKVDDCDREADGIPTSEVDTDEDGYVACTYEGAAWDGAAPFVGSDCAPDNGDKYPGAPELCDGQYNDCDREALSSDDAPEDEVDVDVDGYVGCDYDPSRAEWEGVPPEEGADCDDFDATVFPSAREVCDGQFNDCDDLDYDPASAPDIELDDDADTFVDCAVPSTVTWAGAEDVSWADGLSDCDDADPFTFPGAAPADSLTACTHDADDDGYGDLGAEDPIDAGTDCDDDSAVVHPDANEVCEDTIQIDNDCDGGVNTEAGIPINDGDTVIYADHDGDGYAGTLAVEVHVCELTDGYSLSATDCDDDIASIHPGAAEVCNSIDEDCDDAIDEAESLDPDGSGCIDLYRDADGDGWGDGDDLACLCLTGTAQETEWGGDSYVGTAGDCWDGDADIRPGYGATYGVDPEDPTVSIVTSRTERYDGHDNDCDGYVPVVELDCDDDGSLPLLTNTRGVKLDSWDRFTRAEQVALTPCTEGETRTVETCLGQAQLSATCDTVTGLFVVRYEESADGFGGRFAGGHREWGEDALACDLAGDCDDACPLRCPGGDEVCDGIDNDCTGVTNLADTDGIPASMDASVTLAGTVPTGEIDIDADGAFDCQTTGGVLAGDSLHTSSLDCESVAIPELPADCDDRCGFRFPDAEERCNGFLDTCGGEGEGVDSDDDGYATCGPWSGAELDTEDVFVLVYQPDGTDTGAEEGWVPLLLPRPEAVACDADLSAAVADIVGSETFTLARERNTYGPLVEWCATQTTGRCEVARLTLTEDADEDLWTTWLDTAAEEGVLPAGCEAAPEELVTRTVWSEDRVRAARGAVVAFECRRLYGVPCDEVSGQTPLVDGWDDPRPDLSAELARSVRWWKEVGRYTPTSLIGGTVMTCWGDPTAEEPVTVEPVGGDCDDGRGVANREMAEGPDDLVAIYWDEPIDCEACLDGIDNNCDGAIDCEDATCARCFAGGGVGCAGNGSPCEVGGTCASGGSEALGVGWVAMASLLAAALRRRAA